MGNVINFYKKISVAEIKIEDNPVRTGDEIAVIGPTTGCIIQKIGSMEIDKNQSIELAGKGKIIGIKLNEPARENDKVYVLRENQASFH